jgi:N-glycosylase/DNA lyase
METLIAQIKELENGKIGERIRKRMKELRKNRATPESVFSELCFCLTTANSSAEMGLKVQKALEREVETLPLEKLSAKLRKLGYRFYNVRARYIVEARPKKEQVWLVVKEMHGHVEAREWLVDNIKGLGYKEASHFLRNLGFEELAILDRHIIRTLHEKGLIDHVPATLGRKHYLEYEKKMEKICERTGLTQGALDFYLWYLKTGKVLK